MSARTSPAALRNREPIAAALAPALPAKGRVLMVAEGSGEHAVYLARRFPALTWLPSDPDEGARDSIAAHRRNADLPNLKAPVALDASAPHWPVQHAEAITCINMIHISLWAATEGLMVGAARCLPPGGLLYLYGPYREAGKTLAASNAAFDADLRARNSEWGLRDLSAVEHLAGQHGLRLTQRIDMPANNLSLFFRRA
nr:DUF938 domain-containing protein [Pacificimonas flava]